MRQPIFMMMMGLPGSGKSHELEHFKDNFVVMSSDDIIENVAAELGITYSEAWEDNVKNATTLMNYKFRQAVKERKDIIWDQTNLTSKKRLSVLSQLPKEYLKMVTVVTCDENVRQERLKNRPGKNISKHVDDSMLRNFSYPTVEEGFDCIFVANT